MVKLGRRDLLKPMPLRGGGDLMIDGRAPREWKLIRDPFLFETSVPGIFAAGDARKGSGKRVAAAVGEGSAVVSMVHEYLETV